MANPDSQTTSTARIQDACIHGIIKHYADIHPTRCAIAAPGRPALTYRNLYTKVMETGLILRAHSIGTGDRIAVVLPNGPEMAVMFLACANVAVCAPLNPEYQGRELEFYLGDLAPKALIVLDDPNCAAKRVAEDLGIKVIEVDPSVADAAGSYSIKSRPQTHRPTSLDAGDHNDWSGPHNTALVLHTSGTTSRPKMVPLTHENLICSAENIASCLNLTTSDRCLNMMPLFHIHGLVGALLASLASGGSTVCTPGCQPERFFGWLKEFQPSWYTAVPTMHQAILASDVDSSEQHTKTPLRFVRSSSAALAPKLLNDLENRFRIPFIEAYGMTEASHQIASNPLPPGTRKPGSVGLATGQDISILDESGTALPLGVPGHVAIRGVNVTKGYYNNSAANDAAFVGDWFRTGDLGYLDRDGYLFLTGRMKEIINRGGEKITPREIDERLLEHPSVKEAAVFAIPHPTLGQDVGAAIVPNESAPVTEQELRHFVARGLARHKIPSKILIVPDIPKGPTGKLQRVNLAEMFSAELQSAHDPAIDPVEITVTQAFQRILGAEVVGTNDNFFTLGGDSLGATQLAAHLNSTLPVTIDVMTVFEYPVVAELASRLSTLMNESDA